MEEMTNDECLMSSDRGDGESVGGGLLAKGGVEGEFLGEDGEDGFAGGAMEAEGELGAEDAEARFEVGAAAGEAGGEVFFAGRESGKRGGETEAGGGCCRPGGFEEGEHGGREHVHAEETEVVAEAEAGDDAGLLRDGGRGFLDHALDLVEIAATGDERARDGAVVAKLALGRGLHGGERAALGAGEVEQLTCATRLAAADVEVVADLEEKRIGPDEFASAEHGVAVAERGGLLDERYALAVGREHGLVGGTVGGADDDADLLDAGVEHLVNLDDDDGLPVAAMVGEVLEGQTAFVGAGGGDEGVFNGGAHGEGGGKLRMKGEGERLR